MMTNVLTGLLGSLVRHGATTTGGILAGAGAVTQEPTALVTGAFLAVGGFVMSAYKEKTRHDMELELERMRRIRELEEQGG
jgi:hypothetical protein